MLMGLRNYGTVVGDIDMDAKVCEFCSKTFKSDCSIVRFIAILASKLLIELYQFGLSSTNVSWYLAPFPVSGSNPCVEGGRVRRPHKEFLGYSDVLRSTPHLFRVTT